jgi:type IV secretion system protein VirB9
MKAAFFAFMASCAALTPACAMQSDRRIETVTFHEGEVVPLHSAIGNGLTIVFAPGEQVLAFDAADPSAIGVDTLARVDSLFVKTLHLPKDPKFTVRTQLRNYIFSLESGSSNTAALIVRFDYDHITSSSDSAPEPVVSAPQYRITGEKSLQPSRISDDGVHTFLEWPVDQALPAVFAVNAFGDEEIVDAYMRAGVFTIDRVHSKLIFRIDRKSAKAERLSK